MVKIKIPALKEFLIKSILLSTLSIAGLALGNVIYSLTFKMLAYVIFAIAGFFFFFAPMEWCLLIFFLYLGVEGFAKLLSGYNPIIHIGADIFIFSLWSRFGFRVLTRQIRMPKTFAPFTLLFIIHLCWFLITVLNPYSLSLFSSLAGAKLYVTIVSLYFFGYYLTNSTENARFFMIPWVIVAFLQVGTSLYQSSIGPSSVLSISPYYGYALEKLNGFAFRPFGLTALPGLPSVFIYLSTPFLVYFLFYSRKLLYALPIIILLPFCAMTLFLCQVRSALLKGLLGVLSYVAITIFRFRSLNPTSRKFVLFGTPLAVATLVGLAPLVANQLLSNYSDNQRAIERSLTLFDYNQVSKARDGALDRFLLYATAAPLGAGLSRVGAAAGKFAELNEARHDFPFSFFSDNLWVELVVDIGLPGTIIYTSIVVMIFLHGFFSYLKISDDHLKGIYSAILCSLFAIILGAYGAEPILYNPEGSFFWFFSGVMMRLPTLDKACENSAIEEEFSECLES